MASLYDVRSCLTDAAMNDAALLHVVSLISVALVLRRDGAGGPCEIIPPNATATQAAALITWVPAAGDGRKGGRFELSSQGRSTVAAVQASLLAEAVCKDPRLSAKVAAMKRDEVEAVAARLALLEATGARPKRVTKARLKEFLCATDS